MPYQHDDNYETFMECIGKLSATIEDSDMYNFIILGDFNSAVDTPFEFELLEFCSAYIWLSTLWSKFRTVHVK